MHVHRKRIVILLGVVAAASAVIARVFDVDVIIAAVSAFVASARGEIVRPALDTEREGR